MDLLSKSSIPPKWFSCDVAQLNISPNAFGGYFIWLELTSHFVMLTAIIRNSGNMDLSSTSGMLGINENCFQKLHFALIHCIQNIELQKDIVL